MEIKPITTSEIFNQNNLDTDEIIRIGRDYANEEWTIKGWVMTSEPRVIYIKPYDVPVCLVEKDSDWKPLQVCHTKYGMVDNPLDTKYLYEYLKEIENWSGKCF